LKRLLPQFALDLLRELKIRRLTRGFPRRRVFRQSDVDAEASAAISIVVPIHDAPMVTRRCLASLEKYAPKSEVILVDDASKLAETSEVIQSFADRNSWKVIRHEVARGHSEACRVGGELAARSYLCLLNSDTVVTPWCWRQVIDVFDQDQTIGVVGPSTSDAGTPQVLALARTLRLYWNDNQICFFANQLLSKCEEPVTVELPWVSGFAFFIRRSLWEEIGGFDEKLPDYGNEVELCSRILKKGYRIVWIRNAYIHHFGQQSYKLSIGEARIEERIRAAKVYLKDKNSPC
jgi:GT2 family glycosyltransferase